MLIIDEGGTRCGPVPIQQKSMAQFFDEAADTLEDELTLLYAAIARERARLKYEEAKNEFETVVAEAEAALGSDAAAAIIREGEARAFQAWAERERDDEQN